MGSWRLGNRKAVTTPFVALIGCGSDRWCRALIFDIADCLAAVIDVNMLDADKLLTAVTPASEK
jgi:hypothetical protein